MNDLRIYILFYCILFFNVSEVKFDSGCAISRVVTIPSWVSKLQNMIIRKERGKN